MIIKYKRKFSCDKSIAKGIKWLNKNGFYTVGCCSGLEIDHPLGKRDLLYIEFEGLSQVKISQLKLVARESGFQIKKRRGVLRFESQVENQKLEIFNDFIERLKKNEGALNVRTMGISNWVFNPSEKKKRYSIQFYDYDSENKPLTEEILTKILEIFPLDCLMYKTKHGIQFISFALRLGLKYTKAKTIQTTKDLKQQDYWTTAKDLTLRIAPKWDKDYNEVSSKPVFMGLVKGHNPESLELSEKPKFFGRVNADKGIIISNRHLEFYRKYMDLPENIYNKYASCDKKDFKIKIYHYKTRD